jgi:nickel transport protein
LALKVGDRLPFQVLYDGKPLAGATVGAAGVEKDSLKTDSKGQAEVAIQKSGLNIITASQTTSTPHDPDVDAIGEIATITFEVK